MGRTPAEWQESFTEFEARKIAAALAARPSPYETVLDVQPDGYLRLATPWSSDAFGGPFYVRDSAPANERPTCSLVFVQSAEGNTVADDPTDLGAGETDLHVIYEVSLASRSTASSPAHGPSGADSSRCGILR